MAATRGRPLPFTVVIGARRRVQSDRLRVVLPTLG
jgi:hypothetical protein